MTEKTKYYWNVKLVNCKMDDLLTPLPVNSDEFKGFDTVVNSSETFFDYIRFCAKQYSQVKVLTSSTGKVKFDGDDIINILSSYNLISMKLEMSNDEIIEKSYWVKDYGNTQGLYKPANIKELFEILYDALNMSNYITILTHVENRLQNISHLQNKFKILNIPNNNIILTKNGVLNSQSFKFSTDITAFGDYDFVSKLNFRILHPSQVDAYSLEVNQRIYNDWTDKDLDKITYLKQLGVATLTGNGREVYHILIGPGGNGKSTILMILQQLSSGYYEEINMHELADDNLVNSISSHTKLVLGHELPTNPKFGSKTIGRLKQFISLNPFKVNVKYQNAKLIVCPGVKIQATNSIPKIFENNFAIRDRFNFFKWTDKNFRNLTTRLDLDSMIFTDKFMEANIAFMFCDIVPFEKFIKIKSVEDDTNSIVNGADQVYQFMLWYDEQGLTVGTILTSLLYQEYKIWNKDYNGNITPLKNIEFVERLKNLTNTFEFEIETKNKTRLSTLTNYELNPDVLNKFYFNEKLTCNRYSMSSYIKFKNQITDEDITKVMEGLENQKYDASNFETYKDLLILYGLIGEMNPDAITFAELNELNT